MNIRNICVFKQVGSIEEFILDNVLPEVRDQVLVLQNKEVNLNHSFENLNKIVIIENLEYEKNSDLLPFLRALNKEDRVECICILSKNVELLKAMYTKEWKEIEKMLHLIQMTNQTVCYGAIATRKNISDCPLNMK
ncbi:hypothetical protein [Bacillus toyonensis]|uniref:hypothetical protein n=1 Tax=Bacillus toyonensis TaxID=155322 RepID=UPI001C0B917E|nr:hypothetical protein [Bacillus toyonensis]MBU4643078.1 hypothetical protein [Bacillus toyonensis]